MSNDSHGNYLLDLGTLLRQEAQGAQRQVSDERGTPGHQFALGRLTAYYEVLSLMRQQAVAFGIDFAEISLEAFDPDRELLSE